MRFLKTLFAVLTARWFLTLLGVVILALIVWFFGELLAFADWRPLESELSRLVTILVLTFIWGAGNLLAQRKVRKANEAFVSDLAKAPLPGPADEEIKELSARFNAALSELKKRRLHGRRYLAELPWYLMIGPPGSGKTTALLQSGLRFPLAEADRGYEVRGVGGTRNCDWFFTEEAVLIDTAGRYTTQESHAEADRAAWQGFLDLLKKHRRRRAISGVLIAFPADDLLRADPALVAQHARAIRSRLDELTSTLGLRFPAYMLVTKGDLVAGFNEFFADLSEREREQVLGFTLPIDPAHPEPAARELLEQEFNRLVARLEEGVLARLDAERDLERRALVFRFPGQLAALKSRLVELAERIFYESTFAAPVLLRGLYVTSGTQEGAPIDRLMQAMAASFGLEPAPPPASHGNRSFFLTRLLREVVFAEAGLVARDPARERRERWLEGAAWTAAAVVLVGAAAVWGVGYLQSRNEALALGTALQQASIEVEPLAKTELAAPTDVALAPVLRALDLLRGLPAGGTSPVALRLGLSASDSLGGAADAAYRRGLERLLLPRLVLRLEGDLRARIRDPDFVLQGLKVYLMLTGRAKLDRELIETWFRVVDRPEAEGLTTPEIERLAGHRTALLDLLPEIVERPEPDPALVARAQGTLAGIPLARRAYDALLGLPEMRALPAWNPAEHAGPNAARVLTRRSGKPLGEGIAGIYTYQGFHEQVLPHLKEVVAATAVESWVMDAGAPTERSKAEIEQLQADVLKLYYDDDIAVWQQLLADVTLAPLTDLRSAVDALKDLSGPTSAIKLLLTGIVAETDLTRVPETGDAQAAAADTALKKGTKLLGKVGGAAAKLAALAGGSQPEGAVPGAPVAEHFGYLVKVVAGAEGAPPAIDDATAVLGRLFQELQTVATSPNPEKAMLERGGIAGVTRPLAQEAGRLPAPLDGWLGGVAQQTSKLGGGAVARQLNAIWQTDVLPVCAKALAGRFPFQLDSAIDMDLADFGRLFAPGAVIDGFINANLQPLVDTARRPWRWREDLDLSNAALAQLERARRIRDGMFAGGANPQASFTLRPVDMDAGAARVLLDLDGQQVSYRHDPTHPVPMVWPGPGGSNIVRLTFFPVTQAAPAVLTREGAWSWFRLLREGALEPTGQPDLFYVTLSAGGHWARFELRAASVYNPFDLALLGGFRCPPGI